jgi:hypothetical protein
MEESNTSILTRLTSGDVDVRRVALTELDDVLEVASLSDLLPLLIDEDATVRKLTIRARRNGRSSRVAGVAEGSRRS